MSNRKPNREVDTERKAQRHAGARSTSTNVSQKRTKKTSQVSTSVKRDKGGSKNPPKKSKIKIKSSAPKTPHNTQLNNNRQNIKVPKRTKILFKELTALWNCENIRYRGDDHVVDSISGRKKNYLSLWPSLMVKRARTCASIGTKIKTDLPIKSESDAILEFIETQTQPILSSRYAVLVKNYIDTMFKDFPYESVRDNANDVNRRPIITNGSSSPALLAPAIYGKDNNLELIAAMAAGEDIFLSTFHINEWTSDISDGLITSVPKNYKGPRIITITSRDFINKQYPISDALRDWVTLWSRESGHITQFDDQSVQHLFLKEGNATIDLSSASDRIYRSMIELVWPDFMKYFDEFLPKTVRTKEGRIIPLTCIGTQGFPLTFTVMAIVVGAIVASVKLSNEPSANYGDDIVLSEKDFDEVVSALQALGLKINVNKTHKSSNGFVESCGKDVMFTRNGPRDVTPIHLRGERDIDFVQFFYQLCLSEIIEVEQATSLLDKLQVEYYAFQHDHQITEFHLPFGDIKNIPKRLNWSYKDSQYSISVPALKQEISAIKGLSKTDSTTVLELLRIEAGFKNPNIHKKTTRGTDLVARPYALMDLQDNRLYGLYQKLEATGFQVLKVFYKETMEEYKVSFKAIVYYKFITSELYRYKFSTATVDFNGNKVREFTLSEFIESEFGIKNDVKYPIYRYKPVKVYKTICDPRNNLILDV